MEEVVWLSEERHFAFLGHRDAYFSVVYWFENGERITMIVENDEYELWEERAIDYESDD